MASIRAGIVGAGLMGRWHAETIKKVGGRLAAVADLDPAAARSLASRYPGTVSFSDVGQMLSRVNLDILHICTPTASHYPIAEQAIEAGLNLVVEKPVAPLAEEVERLFDRAADRGVLVCPVHQFVFQDGVQNARAWLPRIGRLVHIGSTIRSAGGIGLAGERLDEIVTDILPHPLSLIQVFLPIGFAAVDWVTVQPGHGEFHALGQVPGLSLSIDISMNGRPTVCTLQLVGTEGTIHLNLFHGYAFVEPGPMSRKRKIAYPFELAVRLFSAAMANLGRRIIHWEPAYPGLRRLIRSFYAAVREQASAPISREQAIAVARARDCLLQSACPTRMPGQLSLRRY